MVIAEGGIMKVIRLIGSLVFVLGLFTAVFAGVPWHVIVADDPAVPWWLQTAVSAFWAVSFWFS